MTLVRQWFFSLIFDDWSFKIMFRKGCFKEFKNNSGCVFGKVLKALLVGVSGVDSVLASCGAHPGRQWMLTQAAGSLSLLWDAWLVL